MSADEVKDIFDELEDIFKTDPRTASIKEYIRGEKGQGLQFPAMFIMQRKDTQSDDNWPIWDMQVYLVLLGHNLDVEQGKQDIMHLAYDISDILDEHSTINGTVHSVTVNKILHKTVKDNQNRVIHRKTLDITIRRKAFIDGSVSTDPWLEALCLWTENELGAGWTVYRNTYPEKYSLPGVIWWLADGSVNEKTGAGFEVTKNFLGQVMGNLPYQQAYHGAMKIIEGLGRDRKIVMNAAERRYLTVKGPNVDMRALNPSVKVGILSPAQITVSLSRVTSRPTEEVASMMHIDGSGNLVT